jgi:hypothetical protein
VTYARYVADHDAGDRSDEPFIPVLNSIFVSPDGEEYVLVIVEERPLGEPEVIDHLANRINLCAEFVLDGRLASELPESAGRSIRIHVDHLQPADADAAAFFMLVTERLADHGIAFSSHLLEDRDRPPGTA